MRWTSCWKRKGRFPPLKSSHPRHTLLPLKTRWKNFPDGFILRSEERAWSMPASSRTPRAILKWSITGTLICNLKATMMTVTGHEDYDSLKPYIAITDKTRKKMMETNFWWYDKDELKGKWLQCCFPFFCMGGNSKEQMIIFVLSIIPNHNHLIAMKEGNNKKFPWSDFWAIICGVICLLQGANFCMMIVHYY